MQLGQEQWNVTDLCPTLLPYKVGSNKDVCWLQHFLAYILLPTSTWHIRREHHTRNNVKLFITEHWKKKTKAWEVLIQDLEFADDATLISRPGKHYTAWQVRSCLWWLQAEHQIKENPNLVPKNICCLKASNQQLCTGCCSTFCFPLLHNYHKQVHENRNLQKDWPSCHQHVQHVSPRKWFLDNLC